jgi:hypothetical protein
LCEENRSQTSRSLSRRGECPTSGRGDEPPSGGRDLLLACADRPPGSGEPRGTCQSLECPEAVAADVDDLAVVREARHSFYDRNAKGLAMAGKSSCFRHRRCVATPSRMGLRLLPPRGTCDVGLEVRRSMSEILRPDPELAIAALAPPPRSLSRPDGDRHRAEIVTFAYAFDRTPLLRLLLLNVQ